MGDRATITYQLARDEVVRTLWRRVASRPRYLQSVGLYAVLGVVLLLAGTELTYAGVLLLAYALARPLILWQVISRAVDRSSLFTDQRTVEFDAAGISASGPDWKTSLPWRHFKGWSEDRVNFYLEVGASGFASIIPKRAMTAEQEQMLRSCLASIPGPSRSRS
jgi:hypothetical protein